MTRNVYRKCAVCGKRHGATYGFRLTLQRLGLPNWKDDKAVPECVTKLQHQRAKEEERYGRRSR